MIKITTASSIKVNPRSAGSRPEPEVEEDVEESDTMNVLSRKTGRAERSEKRPALPQRMASDYLKPS